MLNYLKAFLIFLLWATIALSSHYFITHQYFGNLTKSEENISLKPVINTYFKVKNGNETILSSAKNFTIYQNSASVSSIDSIAFLVDSLSLFLNNNYDKQLEIIGKHSNSENSNLGLLRAKTIKNQLIKKGIATNSIKALNKNETFTYNKNGAFSNGIEMQFIPLNSLVLDSLENAISNKRLHLTIENEQLVESSELSNYLLILKQYLVKHPAKTLEITGHTDNTGYFENNVIKGKIKADKLKEYFIKNGISSIPIKTFSKGESEPIANKYTEEGKAQNNRIEIRIN